MRFHDRRDGGRVLAELLGLYADRLDVIVLALPRGGVPVGYEVALMLHAPLDVFLVRKLGVPGQEELAMGAIASGGVRELNRDVVEMLDIPESTIDQVTSVEGRELARREREYRGDRPPLDVVGRTVILVDDGLATGATMRAALVALRQEGPARVVVGVPVAPESTCEELSFIADEVVCVEVPEPFYGVGFWYDNFAPTSDAEVRELLRRANERLTYPPPHESESPDYHIST